ncbi:MAG TPA: PAS domain-containing protein, partial [Actinomycetota bacterium]|nr:PAS domain-containing protein [Actinomycetota bacterium]
MADSRGQDRTRERLAALDAVRRLLADPDALPGEAATVLRALDVELRQTHGELREAIAKYRALVEQIPAIVYVDVVDETMTTSYVSPQIEPLLGVTPEEYIAQPDLWYQLLHPDDRERALETYLEGRRSGEPFTFEYRLIARDGRVVWFRDSAAVVLDADGNPAFIHGVML